MAAFKDRTGDRIGRLTVVGFAGRKIISGKTRSMWSCRCDCGAVLDVSGDSLNGTNTRSCGCLKRDSGGVRKHKMSRSRTYLAWSNAKARCSNPNHPSFSHYGARGIVMCERWRASFEAFLEDMGAVPDGLELDRIDNDGNYEHGNCRWATRSEQCRNKRYLGRKPRSL